MLDMDFYLNSKVTEKELDNFLGLPPQAQKVIFAFIRAINGDIGLMGEFISNPPMLYTDECQSPIEQILLVAFELCQIERNNKGNLSLMYSMLPQYEINVYDKTYYADFLINPEGEDQGDGRRFKSFPLVIECDGHEFHEKTKEQVKHDNERDFDIKSAGYDILHFSGSQIYNEPWKCANQILDYIIQHTEVIQQNG